MNEKQNTPKQEFLPRQRLSISLRAKILLGIILIVLLTVAAMGYFVFYRSQSTNEFLVNQVGVSVNQEIENSLTATVSREASTIHLFFATTRNVIELFGNASGTLLSNDRNVDIAESDW